MDKQLTLLKYLPAGVFNKTLIIVFFVILTGCPNTNSEHKLYIKNNTNRNLLLSVKFGFEPQGSYRLDYFLSSETTTLFSEGGNHLRGDSIAMQMIREYCGRESDTIEIYCNDTLVIKWGGPLRVMPDSINHFYNEKSWKIEMGGTNNTYEIGTFTIYESDIGHIEGK